MNICVVISLHKESKQIQEADIKCDSQLSEAYNFSGVYNLPTNDPKWERTVATPSSERS